VDAIGLDGASGRVSTRSISTPSGTGVVCESGLIVDNLESSQGSAGVIGVNTAFFQIHGSDLMLDGRSNLLDSSRPYRALVDMGDKLIINFNNDYSQGLVVGSDLIANFNVTVGGNGFPGSIAVKDAAGQDSIRMSGGGNIHAVGNIHAQTVFATLRPPGGDCAEQFEVAGDVAVEPGTVMVIGADGALESCKTAYDARVAGVISGAGDLEPSLVLNEKVGGNRAAIALIGSVYCKCDANYAPIAAGDLLTTSATVGHAMRAYEGKMKVGAIIGKALKPLRSGAGLIPVLVAPR